MRAVQAAGEGEAEVKRLYVYCYGDQQQGMGHVMRQITLARVLLARGIKVTFLTHANTPGHARMVQENSYSVLGTRAADDLIPFVNYADYQQESLLIDLEHGPSRAQLELARTKFRHVIVVAGNGYTLHDYAAVRELADLEIYQTLDAMPGHKAVSGPEHILIDPVYRDCRPNVAGPVVVNWGGADPFGLTEPTLAALAGLERRVVAVVGPARPPLAGDYPGVTVVHAPPSLRPYLDGAALFVGAFGTVVWEACAAGVPSIMLGWSPNHVTTAAQLQSLGVGRSLGLWSDFKPDVLRLCVESWLGEAKLLPRYQRRAKELIDGQGAARVAARIAELLR